METVLTVTAPLKSTVEPATQTVDFGRPAVFTCRYEGNPIKTITWLKDGKDMNHHDAMLRLVTIRQAYQLKYFPFQQKLTYIIFVFPESNRSRKKTKECTSASSAMIKRVPELVLN